MLHGYLDAVTSSGYIEGWAYDSDAPLRPLTVSVLAEGVELAHGIANRYRPDLAEAKCGTGWCAFRLKLYGAVSHFSGHEILLCEPTRRIQIHKVTTISLIDDHEPDMSILEQVVASDPTLVRSIEQLNGCNTVFADFVSAHGVQAFVRAAYVYVLGRPADANGLSTYSALLQNRRMPPFELLRALHDGEEFRSKPRQLIAPPEPGFVFRPA